MDWKLLIHIIADFIGLCLLVFSVWCFWVVAHAMFAPV